MLPVVSQPLACFLAFSSEVASLQDLGALQLLAGQALWKALLPGPTRKKHYSIWVRPF